MDSGAEHIRETRAKILTAKKEIKEYLRLPEDARGLLILTHGKGNVIFLTLTLTSSNYYMSPLSLSACFSH